MHAPRFHLPTFRRQQSSQYRLCRQAALFTRHALSESAPSMGTRVASAGLSLVFMPPWHAPRASGRKQRRCQWCHGAKMPRLPSHRRHHHTRGPPRGKVANAPEGRQTGRLVHCASPPLDARLPEGFPGVLGDSCGGVDHDDPQLRRERALGQLPRHAGRCRRGQRGRGWSGVRHGRSGVCSGRRAPVAAQSPCAPRAAAARGPYVRLLCYWVYFEENTEASATRQHAKSYVADGGPTSALLLRRSSCGRVAAALHNPLLCAKRGLVLARAGLTAHRRLPCRRLFCAFAMASKQCLMRMAKEVSMLAKAPPEGVSAWPAGDGANLQVGRQRAFRRERCAWHEALICPPKALRLHLWWRERPSRALCSPRRLA